jgi:hypothetical protein
MIALRFNEIVILRLHRKNRQWQFKILSMSRIRIPQKSKLIRVILGGLFVLGFETIPVLIMRLSFHRIQPELNEAVKLRLLRMSCLDVCIGDD